MRQFLLPRDVREALPRQRATKKRPCNGSTTKETAMRVPSPTASRPHHIICPFCESGELVSVGPGFARCGSCGLPLLGSALETLREIVGLPDALGAHPCECGHPEMRGLPDGVRIFLQVVQARPQESKADPTLHPDVEGSKEGFA